jgi:hypothetical protein
MDVLFFTFANDPLQPLPTLQKEKDEISDFLTRGEQEGRYNIHMEQPARRERIAQYLTGFHQDIVLFHYSGHAGRDALWTREEASQAGGIAQLLGQCPRLKLVFLNGCSTQGQVKALWEAGVPVIIATSAPVDDRTATTFAIRFYQALSSEVNLETAFNFAKGDALALKADLDIPLKRGIQFREERNEEPVWGLFVQKGRDNILDWRLPKKDYGQREKDYIPNQLLLDTLMEVLAPFDRQVRHLKEDEEAGETISLSDKKLYVTNCMPEPIADQLRKLLMPTPDEEEQGFDQISLARLKQLTRTATTIIELYTDTLLAQLWEAKEKYPELELTEALRQSLSRLIQLRAPELTLHNYISLTRSIREVLDSIEYPFFFKELRQHHPDSPFRKACEHLNLLRHQLIEKNFPPDRVPEACRKGEESLATILRELGFLAKYTLAAVHLINAVKFRHQEKPTFSHMLIKLVKTVGGTEQQREILDEVMYSRSVLMLKTENGNTRFLNLSPFIIDKYALDKDPSDKSKLYFFHYYQPVKDPPLAVSKDNYSIVKEQFDAFSQLIFEKPMAAVFHQSQEPDIKPQTKHHE